MQVIFLAPCCAPYAGTIPAPVLFGYILDASCILWESDCDDQGACFYYDKTKLGLYIYLLSLMYKLLSILFLVLAWKLYKPPKDIADVVIDVKAATSPPPTVMTTADRSVAELKQNVGGGVLTAEQNGRHSTATLGDEADVKYSNMAAVLDDDENNHVNDVTSITFKPADAVRSDVTCSTDL